MRFLSAAPCERAGMLKRKPTSPSAPVATAADAIAALDERLIELRLRDRALLAELLELEAAGAVPIAEEKVSTVDADALALLAGGEPVDAPLPSPNARLHRVLAERRAIKRALEMGEQRGFRLRV